MPVNLRIASGQRWNRYATGTVTVTNEHAVLTKDRLGDGRPSRAYRALTNVTDLALSVDGNHVLNGGLDTWAGGLPTSWTPLIVGAGSTATAEATIKQAGAFALKLTTGNVGGAYAGYIQDIEVRAGDTWSFASFLRGDGGAAAAKVRVQNLFTGLFLQSNGTWGASGVAMSRTANAGGTQGYGTVQAVTGFAVESFTLVGKKDQTKFRIELFNDTQNTTVYIDEVYGWPSFNCASLHGSVNVPGYMPVLLRSSDDGVTYATEGTFAAPLTSPAAYLLLGALVHKRYSQIKFSTTPQLPIEIGEATTTQVVTPAMPYLDGDFHAARWPRLASVTPSGERRIHKTAKFRNRSRVFDYELVAADAAGARALYDQADELFNLRSEGDTYPALFIPDTDFPDVIHGRVGATISMRRDNYNRYVDLQVELAESPFASAAS